MRVLDLFSGAAGGWSLGLHRAGFRTVAACEAVEWRRALYLQNNPGVRMYDDVRTLTGEQLLRDLGFCPDIVVGSPPCQDISPANTKGKGVEGERSGLYFDAIRIIGGVRPRWFALENSANLRTRGADAVLAALEELGYACWAFVVRAGDIGSNHERARSWLIGCDISQIADADHESIWGAVQSRTQGQRGNLSRFGPATGDICRQDGARQVSRGHGRMGEPSHADQAGQANGPLEPSLRQAQEPNNGCGLGWCHDGQGLGQMGLCETDCGDAFGRPADWSLDDLADHLQLDDGLSAWLAGTRIAVGGPRGTSAASLIVEAFGDAVVPQIPEAIGRAILRVEAALSAIYSQRAAA